MLMQRGGIELRQHYVDVAEAGVTQLEIKYVHDAMALTANGTAGLARSLVNGNRRPARRP